MPIPTPPRTEEAPVPSSPTFRPSTPPKGSPAGAVHGVADTTPHPDEAAAPGTKPKGLPDKFWDAAGGTVRLDALIRSYRALERRLSEGTDAPAHMPAAAQLPRPGVPDSAAAYRIDIDDPFVRSDPAVNEMLHAAGFTEDQVQLVYDLASEVLTPVARGLAMRAAGAEHKARLEAHFGGPERWTEVRRQLLRWARGKLPEDAYKALASTYEGVLALHRMMERKEEPAPLGQGEPVPELTEDQLRRKMRDPRYWRDRDPAIQREVSDGFKRLYPSG